MHHQAPRIADLVRHMLDAGWSVVAADGGGEVVVGRRNAGQLTDLASALSDRITLTADPEQVADIVTQAVGGGSIYVQQKFGYIRICIDDGQVSGLIGTGHIRSADIDRLDNLVQMWASVCDI